MIRTIPIKLNNIDEGRILDTMRQCVSIYNEHISWSLENKTYNKSKAHKAIYDDIRKKYPDIPSAIIQSTRDTALESVKATKFKRTPQKRNMSIRYDLRTMTLRGNQLTFSCIGKRQRVILNIPEYFKKFLSWKFKGGTICYKNNEFKVNLHFFSEDVQKKKEVRPIGIDRGIYNTLALSDGTIIKGNKARRMQRKHLYNRRKIQVKGTPSAKRKLKRLSGKEKRFNKDFNHCVSKQVAHMPYNTFVIENLKGILNKRRSRKLNKWLHSWPFYQFEIFLDYKANALGKSVVKVSAKYTSQKCSLCGTINGDNRMKSHYICGCGYTNHSDINAAINIKQNYLLSLNTDDKQAAVNQPIVSACTG